MRSLLYFVMVLILIIGCVPNEEKVEKKVDIEKEIGKYVYKTKSGSLHINRSCYRMYIYDSLGVHIINIDTLAPSDLDFICLDCVSDKNFEELVCLSLDNCIEKSDSCIEKSDTNFKEFIDTSSDNDINKWEKYKRK